MKARGLIQSVGLTSVSSHTGNLLLAILANPFIYDHCTPHLTLEAINSFYGYENLQNKADMICSERRVHMENDSPVMSGKTDDPEVKQHLNFQFPFALPFLKIFCKILLYKWIDSPGTCIPGIHMAPIISFHFIWVT